MTSHSTGSPMTEGTIFCRPKLRTWDLTSKDVSETGGVLENPGCTEFYGISCKNHLPNDALVLSLSYFWKHSRMFLSSPSLCMCGLRPKNLSLPWVHWVGKRWEWKSNQFFWETYPAFARKPERNLFLYNKPSKNWAFLQASQRCHIDGREGGVPRSLGKCLCIRLNFSSRFNDIALVEGPKFVSRC